MPALQDGSGTANTNVVFHAKQLLALQEQDLPYLVRSSVLHHAPASSGATPLGTCLLSETAVFNLRKGRDIDVMIGMCMGR